MNIMCNQVCNFTCPYCFANEFVGRSEESLRKDKSQITLENFQKAVDFAVKSKEDRIGLIGGEPLLHPQFEKLVEIAINTPVRTVHLFTNGVFLDKYFHLLGSDKFTILINVNSPEDVGEKQYKKVVENIDYLVNKMHAKKKISVGVNIYKEDMNFDFMTSIIKRFGFNRLRLAITVPNTNNKREESAIEYFQRMKVPTFKLFEELYELGCMPSYDCNGMPICITTDEEKKWLRKFWEFEEKMGFCNITENHRCHSVIDILPNLDVVRCFGMSEVLKVSMEKFENAKQIRGYFAHEIDNLMSLIPTDPRCKTCLYKNSDTCSGGCLAFKLNKFAELKDLIREKIV